MKKWIWVVCLAAVVSPRAVWALDACDHDRPKVCGGVTPGNGAMHDCMLMNVSKLSPDCQNTVQQSESLVQQLITNCKDDAAQYCSLEMNTRPTAVWDCVKNHKDKFSTQCRRLYRQLKAYDYPVMQ